MSVNLLFQIYWITESTCYDHSWIYGMHRRPTVSVLIARSLKCKCVITYVLHVTWKWADVRNKRVKKQNNLWLQIYSSFICHIFAESRIGRKIHLASHAARGVAALWIPVAGWNAMLPAAGISGSVVAPAALGHGFQLLAIVCLHVTPWTDWAGRGRESRGAMDSNGHEDGEGEEDEGCLGHFGSAVIW